MEKNTFYFVNQKIKCEYYMDIKKKDVRPYLNKAISTEDFLDYYWLKEEL